MLLGEPGLDGALTFMQPIERGVELVFVDLAQGQLHAQARGCRGRIERLGGGELGGRRDDATDDHGHDQITRPVGLTAVPGPQQPVEANGAGRTQHGRDVSVRQRTLDRQRLLTSRDHDAALQDAAQALDMFGRPIREIEQRALADGLAVPITLSEEDSGRRIPVRHGLDVHGACVSRHDNKINKYLSIYMATFSSPNKAKYA